MKNYRVYLFDLDGTLTNTGPTWLTIFRDGLADFGITGHTDREIAAHTHDWKEVTKLGVPDADVPTFIETAYARANERLPLAPMYEGAELMLQKLKKTGKKIGIFTTMDRPILEPVVARYKFDELFDVIVAGTDVEHRKPHPAGIEFALRKLGEQPDGTVYLGDKDTDILCGKNAGTDSILFYPADHKLMYDRKVLLASKPTFIINEWHELTASL